jgi:hypothetical protein
MAQDSTASNKALVQASFDCWKSGPLKAKLEFIAKFSTRHALSVIAIAALFAVVSGVYVIRHFAINTDINKLISPDLPWRQQELAFWRAFPQSVGTISAVVDAPTAELADQASSALAQKLLLQTNLFETVDEPASSSLFVQNGLLFLPAEQLANITGALIKAKPLIQVLQTDPTLRGLARIVSFGLAGVRIKGLTLDEMARPFPHMRPLLGWRSPDQFSWQELSAIRPNPLTYAFHSDLANPYHGALEWLKSNRGDQGDRGDLKLESRTRPECD